MWDEYGRCINILVFVHIQYVRHQATDTSHIATYTIVAHRLAQHRLFDSAIMADRPIPDCRSAVQFDPSSGIIIVSPIVRTALAGGTSGPDIRMTGTLQTYISKRIEEGFATRPHARFASKSDIGARVSAIVHSALVNVPLVEVDPSEYVTGHLQLNLDRPQEDTEEFRQCQGVAEGISAALGSSLQHVMREVGTDLFTLAADYPSPTKEQLKGSLTDIQGCIFPKLSVWLQDGYLTGTDNGHSNVTTTFSAPCRGIFGGWVTVGNDTENDITIPFTATIGDSSA